MTDREKLEVAREVARDFGKKGGRPRKVAHVGGPVPAKGCRCVECRAARSPRVAETPKARREDLDYGYGQD